MHGENGGERSGIHPCVGSGIVKCGVGLRSTRGLIRRFIFSDRSDLYVWHHGRLPGLDTRPVFLPRNHPVTIHRTMSGELASTPMAASIRRAADVGDAENARPEKRQRKQRPCYSCEGRA